jgi:5,10-methylene-tetrahydrofolate dehydrogenase/methenyl tetrahydrofolate cyclohydrolase
VLEPSPAQELGRMAKIIDGKAMAAVIHGEVKAGVVELQKEKNITPGLAVVLVGERKDSQTYVRSKKKAAEEVG